MGNFFEDMFKGDPGTESASLLSTQQRILLDSVAKYLQGLYTQPATPYGGQLTPEMPAIMDSIMSDMARYYGTDVAGIRAALGRDIAGEPNYRADYEGAEKRWREKFASPAMSMYRQEVMPTVREGFNIPGSFYGGDRARGERNALNTFYGGSVLPTLYGSLEAETAREFQSGEAAAGRRLGATQMLAGLPNAYMQNIANYMGLKQPELTAAYREFLRTSPEASPWLQMATGISTTPTVESFGYVTEPFAEEAMQGIAAIIGAMSDKRLKENIEQIDNALEKVKQLDGKTFNFIGEVNSSAGLLAQDIEEVLPEAVSTNEDGYLMVDYGMVVALLVNAIKELANLVGDK